MTDVRDGDSVNRSIAEHVAETRESLERGRAEIERQRQVLNDLYRQGDDEEAAA